jgi:hypothetical protein
MSSRRSRASLWRLLPDRREPTSSLRLRGGVHGAESRRKARPKPDRPQAAMFTMNVNGQDKAAPQFSRLRRGIGPEGRLEQGLPISWQGVGPARVFAILLPTSTRGRSMNCMKLARLAMAGAALLLCAATTAPSGAAPVGSAATQSTTGQTESSLIDVGYRHHGHYGHYGRYRRGGFGFFFAPVIVPGGGYYGYDDYGPGPSGPSCYSICREYRGPDYCRYYWRRYC